MPRYPGKAIVDRIYSAIQMTSNKSFLSYKNEAIFSDYMSRLYKETISFTKKHTPDVNKDMLTQIIDLLDELETDGDYYLFYYQDQFRRLLSDNLNQ
ncbi:MAG: hypothetical protein SPL00_04920 [Bacilli bacterium]|nr:hypothetical protein [Bacilli bacterium]